MLEMEGNQFRHERNESIRRNDTNTTILQYDHVDLEVVEAAVRLWVFLFQGNGVNFHVQSRHHTAPQFPLLS